MIVVSLWAIELGLYPHEIHDGGIICEISSEGWIGIIELISRRYRELARGSQRESDSITKIYSSASSGAEAITEADHGALNTEQSRRIKLRSLQSCLENLTRTILWATWMLGVVKQFGTKTARQDLYCCGATEVSSFILIFESVLLLLKTNRDWRQPLKIIMNTLIYLLLDCWFVKKITRKNGACHMRSGW